MNNLVNTITTYLKGVRAEWGKITWPEKSQVFAETLFVVVIVFVFTVTVYAMDKLFQWSLKSIHNMIVTLVTAIVIFFIYIIFFKNRHNSTH